MIKLKSKIYFGLSFLILIIAIISLFSIILLNQLSDDSSSIIRDNYHSIDYTFLMQSELDDILNLHQMGISDQNTDTSYTYVLYTQVQTHLNNFENILNVQESNITEKGERELVKKLIDQFNQFKNNIVDNRKEYFAPGIQFVQSDIVLLKNILQDIYSINMKSILRKNDIAANTSSKVINYMVIITSASLIAILFFIFYFPNYILSPIKELTNKIHAISLKKYDQKIDIITNDELGELTESFNIMAERLSEYEAQHMDQLLLEKNRIESLVHGLNDAVILLDEDFNLILINGIAQRIFSLDHNNLLNQSIFSIDSKSSLFDKVSGLIYSNSNSADNNINEHVVYDETLKQYFNVDIIKIKTDNRSGTVNEVKGLVIILKNVTHFTERDIAKTNLLATVSHELKTPISSINLTLKLLRDYRLGNLNGEQLKLIDQVSEQNRRLLKVVNELLSYSQVETGKINLFLEKIDPFQIIDLSSSALMMLIAEREINLEYEIENNLPLIKADLEKSVWILVNILTNAIRYSPQQGKITIGMIRRDDCVRFSIMDEGPGIPHNEKKSIFEKYVKDKDGYFKGTGLGLAIAKEFVESQNGKIWVQNGEVSGSLFCFTLPIA